MPSKRKKISKRLKTYRGIKNPKFRKIIRNRDNGGYILTYSVKIGKVWYEFNTLKEARVMAIKV